MATMCAQHPGACEFRPQGKGNLQGRPQAAKATGTPVTLDPGDGEYGFNARYSEGKERTGSKGGDVRKEPQWSLLWRDICTVCRVW